MNSQDINQNSCEEFEEEISDQQTIIDSQLVVWSEDDQNTNDIKEGGWIPVKNTRMEAQSQKVKREISMNLLFLRQV